MTTPNICSCTENHTKVRDRKAGITYCNNCSLPLPDKKPCGAEVGSYTCTKPTGHIPENIHGLQETTTPEEKKRDLNDPETWMPTAPPTIDDPRKLRIPMNLPEFFGFCVHNWKIIDTRTVTGDEDSRWQRYYLQCKKCGITKIKD